ARRRGRRRPRCRCGAGRVPGLAGPASDRARPGAPRRRAHNPRAKPRARRAGTQRDRQAERTGAVRDRGRGPVLRAVRRARERHPRRHHRPRPGLPFLHAARAVRRGGRDPALERAAQPGGTRGRAGPRGRQHGRREAVGVHVWLAAEAGPARGRRVWPPAGRAERRDRHGRRGGGGARLAPGPPGGGGREGAFGGSVRAGREVGRIAAERIIPLTLELGGKSPNIVFADADLRRAVPGSVRGFVMNAGQVCLAGTRIVVERAIHDEFAAALADAVRGIPVGAGEGAVVGPMTTRAQYEKVRQYYDVARSEGAVALAGGALPESAELRRGWFVTPTVYTGVRNDMRIAREEIFGPVACVLPFAD